MNSMDKCEDFEILFEIIQQIQQELAKRTTYCVEAVRTISSPSLNIINSRVPPARFLSLSFDNGYLKGSRMTAAGFDRDGRVIWAVGDANGPRYDIHSEFDYDLIIKTALEWIDNGVCGV